MDATRRVVVIGDVHGQLEQLTRLLHDAGLIDDQRNWSGGTASLWLTGDFFDRGPDGIGVVDLVMRLQREALASSGKVAALLGNHEVMVLAVRRFGDQIVNDIDGYSFYDVWIQNGGNEHDLEALTESHTDWIRSLPAMALEAERLLMHPDSLMYKRMGKTIGAVNNAVAALLEGDAIVSWDRFIREAAKRKAFVDLQPFGAALARHMLHRYGGRQIVHGHTPITAMTGEEPSKVTRPLLYANGACINMDGGMYLGGPGFWHELTPMKDATVLGTAG
ncbi:MAG: Metallophosphoesterase [Chloroflexi bacterium]|nr:Metallophosphoesterase [Chloroflexota bacterium]